VVHNIVAWSCRDEGNVWKIPSPAASDNAMGRIWGGGGMNKGKWKVEEEQARLGKINSKDCLRRKYRLSRDGGKITLPERGRYLVLLDLL
jgi:hypothetical protein